MDQRHHKNNNNDDDDDDTREMPIGMGWQRGRPPPVTSLPPPCNHLSTSLKDNLKQIPRDKISQEFFLFCYWHSYLCKVMSRHLLLAATSDRPKIKSLKKKLSCFLLSYFFMIVLCFFLYILFSSAYLCLLIVEPPSCQHLVFLKMFVLFLLKCCVCEYSVVCWFLTA